MKLIVCRTCGHHYFHSESHCANCERSFPKTKGFRKGRSAGVALMLGIGLMACGSEDQDSGKDTAEAEPAAEPANEPGQGDAVMYGVEDTGGMDTAADTGTAEPAGEPEYGVPDTGN